MAHHIKLILRDAFTAMIVRICGAGLVLLVSLLASRWLGPAEFGRYTSTIAIGVFVATMSPLGTDKVLVRILSTDSDDALICRSLAKTHACAFIVCAGLFVLTWLSGLISFSHHSGTLAEALGMSTLVMMPLTVSLLRQWAAIPLIGTRNAIFPEQIIVPASFSICLVAGLFTGIPATARFVLSMYALILAVVWVLSLKAEKLRAIYAGALKQLSTLRLKELIEFANAGLPFLAISLGTVWVQSFMSLAVAASCGFESAAVFALALPIATVPAMSLGIINLSFISRFAVDYKAGDLSSARQAGRIAASASFYPALAAALAILLLQPMIMKVVGPEYIRVGNILPPLLLGVLMDCLAGPTTPVMQTMNMQGFYARSLIICVSIQIGITWLAGRIADVEGVALGFAMSRVLWNAVIATAIFRQRGLVMLPCWNLLALIRNMWPGDRSIYDALRSPNAISSHLSLSASRSVQDAPWR